MPSGWPISMLHEGCYDVSVIWGGWCQTDRTVQCCVAGIMTSVLLEEVGVMLTELDNVRTVQCCLGGIVTSVLSTEVGVKLTEVYNIVRTVQYC